MKQESRQLTVWCGQHGKAMTGTAGFRKVTWKTVTNDGNATASWAGRVDGSGTHIQGTWQLVFSDGDRMSGNFAATKQ